MRSITSTIEIDAGPEQVWQALTAGGMEWNPFITSITGPLKVGGKLRVTFRRGVTFRPVVTAIKPSELLEWVGKVGISGIFDGRHRFEISDTKGGRTQLTQSEEFSGILVPLLGRMITKTNAEFDEMNAALAAHLRSTISG